MEEGAEEVEQHLTQLCDFWWFEHLLVVPGVDEDVINFFGGLFPMREAENCSLPAQVSARLFLRHIKEYISQFLEEPEEQDTGENGRHRREDLLQALGLLHRLSLKQQQFRRPEAAVAVRPPVELVTEVVTHVLTAWLCGEQHPLSFGSQQPLPVTSDNIAYAAEQLVLKAELEHMLEDEVLQSRISLLQQLLGAELAPGQLHYHIQQAFPVEAMEVQLQEYADNGLLALGPTTLQLHQKLVENRQLPPDPLQPFAERQIVSTQGMEAAEAEDLAGPLSHMASKPPRRAAELVSLLGEATAPFDALADMQLQADELAAAQDEGDDSVLEDSQPVKVHGRHKRRDGRTHQELPTRHSRQQLQLEPTKSAGRVAAAAAGDGDAAAAAGMTEAAVRLVAAGDEAAEGAAATASLANAGKKTRKSRRQQLPEQADAEGHAQAAGDEILPATELDHATVVAAAAAEAGSGGRKRAHVRPAPPAAAASKPATAAAAEGGEACAAGKGSKSLAGAFMDVLSRPLTAAAGSLAAAVLRSPAEFAAAKDHKMCGAPAEGAKGKPVLWDSPLGGSVDSPQEASPVPKRSEGAREPPAAPVAPAAAAAGGPISKALKRKRAQKAQMQKHPLAAVVPARGRGADSSNTEYEDAREDGGVLSDAEAPPGAKSVGGGGAAGGGRTQQESDPAADEWLPDELEDSTDDSKGGAQQTQHGNQQKPATYTAAAAAAAGEDSDEEGGAARGATAALHDYNAEPKRRRRNVRWSEEEVQLLMELVAEFGEGQWSLIHKKGAQGFHIARTQVDLKDKWRNLNRFKST